ncbi:hypothetical protein ACHAXR_009479 [Thalassiosira sp. AJA248-18]
MANRITGSRSILPVFRNLTTYPCAASKPLATLAALESTSSLHALPSAAYSSSPPLLANNSTLYHRQFPAASSTRCFSSAPTTQPDVKLYQYHICPFCNITKSLLSYSKLDYESVEVNPLTKAELKPWSGDYRKVPIALIGEEQINGSDEILNSILDLTHVQNILKQRWADEITSDDSHNTMTMQQFQRSDNAQKWSVFARDDLAALLYPNICGSIGDSYDAFGYVKNVESFSALQKMSIQSLGALAMYFAASKVKSKRNITDEKEALREALDKFESEGLQDGKLSYSSGLQCPDMGDLAVFGVLYSVRGLNAHNDAIQSRGGPVKEWYDRMFDQVIGE